MKENFEPELLPKYERNVDRASQERRDGPTSKAALREMIKADVAAYLSRGGRISECPTGLSGIDLSMTRGSNGIIRYADEDLRRPMHALGRQIVAERIRAAKENLQGVPDEVRKET